MDRKRFIRDYLFRKTLLRNAARIKRQERIPTDEIDASWKNVEKLLSCETAPHSILDKPMFRQRLVWVGSVAASLLLIISISLWHTYNSPATTATAEIQHVYVPNGKSIQVRLPDGTEVYANAGSHVSYPSAFRKDRREINIEGEAYLEVAHNAKVPFIVKANGFDVRVLGTKFNISAYPGERSASVVLVQGSVQIETAQQEKTLLRPNELADITPEGTCTRQVDVSRYISWKDHFIMLDEERLSEVLKRLSTYYGVDIRCDAKVAGLSLSGKLNLNNSVEEVIGVLYKTAKLNYAKEGNGYRLYKK